MFTLLVSIEKTLHISNDFGTTWNPITSSTLPSLGIWMSISCDKDCQNIVAVSTFSGSAYSSAYYSNDMGLTWNLAKLTSDTYAWGSSAISSDGRTMYVVSDYGYTSTDSGATWSLSYTLPKSTRFSKIACDSTGTQLTLAVFSGPVYRSSDSGITWKEQNINFSLQNDFGVMELDSIIGNYSGSYVVFVFILLFMGWGYRHLVNDKAQSEKKSADHK